MFEQKHLFPLLFSFPPAVSSCIALWENTGAARSETTACFGSDCFYSANSNTEYNWDFGVGGGLCRRTVYTLKGFAFKTLVLLFRKQKGKKENAADVFALLSFLHKRYGVCLNSSLKVLDPER